MNRIPKPGELYRHYTGKVYQILTVAKHSETDERLVVMQAMYGTYESYASPLSQFVSEVDHQKYPRVKQQYWFEPISKMQLALQGYPDQAKAERQEKTAGAEINGRVSEAAAMEPGIKTDIQPDIKTDIKPDLEIETEAKPEAHINPEAGINPEVKPRSEPEDDTETKQKLAQRPFTRSPAESRRAFREDARKEPDIEDSYMQRRRRQLADRESRREQFLKPKKPESATDELRANPCLLKFLDADTYEAKYRVLTEIQEEMTDRLIDDMAVVLDVVIPEGPLNDRYYQLRNIILTRQKYETIRYR